MARSIFDLVKVVYEDQSIDAFDTWDEAEQKAFQPYMINRIISMNPDYLPLVNEIQQYGTLTPRLTYLFYSQMLPKGRQFSKYVKAAKETKYEEWMIELLSRHFGVSNSESIEYLEILLKTEKGRAELREIAEDYATDPKKLKKAKL